MKSKSKIEKQLQKKTNPNLVKTIISAKKSEKWQEVASILSKPRREIKEFNIKEINQNSKEGEIILAPGKVLSQGEIEKKIKIIALSFSKAAEEKLLKAKCELSLIADEIKKNPDAKNIKILK
ncbi:MAG: 50S ribosomal protein L18e [Nanoarchaeota archaeon]